MFTLRVAFRNILRNRRRSALTLLAVTTGTVAMILFGGFIYQSFWGLRESTIRSQYAHLQVYKKGYQARGASNPLAFAIPDAPKVFEAIQDAIGADVEVATARLEFSALIGNEDRSVICLGRAVDPDKEAQINTFLTIVEGINVSARVPDGAILGRGLADGLGAKLGDRLTLMSTTKGGSLNAVDVTVAGIFVSGAKEYDDVAITVPLKLGSTLLATEDPLKVVVLLKDTERTDAARAKLEAAFSAKGLDLEVVSWSDLALFYHRVVGLYTNIFTFVRVVIAIIVVFSIANTLMMSVMERVREIGTIRALGTKRRGVISLFLLEGLLLGIFGGVLGIVVGIIAAKLISALGIQVPPPPGQSKGYTLEIFVVPVVIGQTFALCVITSLLSAMVPARKASRMSIAEALRYD